MADRAGFLGLAGLAGLGTGESVLGNPDHTGSYRVLAGGVIAAVDHDRAPEDSVLAAGELKSLHRSLNTDIAIIVSPHRAQVAQRLLGLLALLWLLVLLLLSLLPLLHSVRLTSGLLDPNSLSLRIHTRFEAFTHPFSIHGSQVTELVNADGILLISTQATDFRHNTGPLGLPVKQDRSFHILVPGKPLDGRNQSGVLLLLLLLLQLLLLGTLLLSPCLFLLRLLLPLLSLRGSLLFPPLLLVLLAHACLWLGLLIFFLGGGSGAT